MTVHKRAMLVDMARDELGKRPTEHDANPPTYQPPEWLIAALESAYDAGAAQAGLYPEGG